VSKLKILKYGDQLLRKKSAEIKEISDDIRQLASDMFETMYAAPGAGLAAIQAGYPIQLFIIDVSQDKSGALALINPKIIDTGDKIIREEGCLSFPGIYADVKRFETVTVQYLDLNGRQKVLKAQGLASKAIQHEIDHLNGKLFIDYLEDWKRKILEKEIRRKKKSGDW
jgi:peptide deformylase